jgi:Ca2+-binding EF-hand superfamily protein
MLTDIIESVDENGDGKIQFNEFVHMMQKIGDL